MFHLSGLPSSPSDRLAALNAFASAMLAMQRSKRWEARHGGFLGAQVSAMWGGGEERMWER